MPKATVNKSEKSDAYIGKTTSTKKVKDLDAPKKPQSSYFIFAAEQRQVVKDENKKATFGNQIY